MLRSAATWLPAYLRQTLRPRPRLSRDRVTIHLALADHFEPFWNAAGHKVAESRLAAWEKGLPRLCQGLADSRGRPPQHTFFYPLEDYHPWIIDRLAALCRQGLGDVEVHLHHHGETRQQLVDLLGGFCEVLEDRHGLLRRDPQSARIVYGFIHGNWALDNSRPDGRWCGVNDEISVLKETGCYADFTLPCAPDPCQTRTINAIYYATDDPLRPKSHDTGRPARVGQAPCGDLLLVQGVLALNWRRRKWGLLPHLENSDLASHNPPASDRLPVWLAYAPRVIGAEHHLFLKLSCHGAPEDNQAALLGPGARAFFQELLRSYNNGHSYEVRFCTTWEMVSAIHQLEQGAEP